MINQIFSFFIILTTCWLTFFNEKISTKDHPVINESFSLFIIASCFLVFFDKKIKVKENLGLVITTLLVTSDQYSVFLRGGTYSSLLPIVIFMHYICLFMFVMANIKKDKSSVDHCRHFLNSYSYWGPIFLLVVQLVLYTSKYQWALISFAIWAIYSLLFSLFKNKSITQTFCKK